MNESRVAKTIYNIWVFPMALCIICMSILGCDNRKDAEIARLKAELEIANSTIAKSGAVNSTPTAAPRPANQMTAIAFRAGMPKEPVTFRVIANLEDFYNGDWLNGQKEFYSINLFDDQQQHLGYGYIHRNSEGGQKLFQLLQDGNAHRAVMSLHHGSSTSGQLFAIHSIHKLGDW